MTELPQSVHDLAELPPIEDVLFRLIRPYLPDLALWPTIPDSMAGAIPFALVRRQYSNMHWRGDARSFTDQAYVQVDSFTKGPDGDEEGAILSEAVRVALRNAWINQDIDPVTGGAISAMKLINPPRRNGDWANATGPVQYADLPADAWRYTAVYRITFRYSR